MAGGCQATTLIKSIAQSELHEIKTAPFRHMVPVVAGSPRTLQSAFLSKKLTSHGTAFESFHKPLKSESYQSLSRVILWKISCQTLSDNFTSWCRPLISTIDKSRHCIVGT